MNDYYNLCRKILAVGDLRENERTGHGVRSLFGESMTFDLSDGRLPVVARKRVDLFNILAELNWFLRGSTNANELKDRGVNIWNEWADESGELGPVYGKQWIDWCGVDQIDRLIDGLRNNPTSRRHIVSAWNVGEIDEMALPPCHMMFQCYARGEFIDMQMYQRSADMFLGVPYNITSYALLLTAIATSLDKLAGKLRIVLGDAHIYENHTDATEQMLANKEHPRPHFEANLIQEGGAWQVQALIEPYKSGPFIPAPVAV